MKFTQAIKMAVSSILSNKMRSFLTMLGIIIGISSVIIMIAIGEGSKKDVADTIQGMGTNLITISLTGGRDKKFTTAELDELKTEAGIKEIAPDITGNATVKAGTKSAQASIEGSTPAFEEVRNVHAQSGRFINQDDEDNRYKVAVIGVELATTIFGNTNVVGETITISGSNFTIVGVLEQKGSSMGGSNDNKVIIPLSTGQRLLKNTSIRTFYVEATTPEDVSVAMANLELFLFKKFNGDSTSFRVFNQTDLLETSGEAANSMTMMLAGIAAISLFVGGIGIMNIMLVSVTERTREIGIRKAIGAKRRDILTQFLIEALYISGVGGIMGVLIGFVGCKILPKMLSQSVIMSTNIVMISFLFAATVGIIFGLYPANKASKLKPIDALRYE